MASRMPSFEAFGSPVKPGNATTHLCRSVNRTLSGSTSGCCSTRAIAMSSASCQVMGIPPDRPASLRNLHHDVPLDHGLAAEPRMQRQALGGVQPILLVLLHRREVLLPLAHDHVARGAGAAPAAVVLEVNALG